MDITREITREEAIANLNMISVAFVEPVTEEQRKLIDDTFDMAIKALEQEPCEDAISRQAVLDLAKKGVLVSNGNYKSVCKAINELPPVNPQKSNWIPVSERLPEDGRPVLIYAWNVHHVIARYDEFRTANGYKKIWVTADAWNGNTEINHEVIAWMPLPEPYKAESEGSMSKTDELEFLKCDLENMITGMTICEGILSKEEKDHLSLHRRCLSVLERIKVVESEDKG